MRSNYVNLAQKRRRQDAANVAEKSTLSDYAAAGASLRRLSFPHRVVRVTGCGRALIYVVDRVYSDYLLQRLCATL